MSPALIYANLLFEPGFWLQVGGIGIGFGLGCLLSICIHHNIKRVYLSLPGFSIGMLCVSLFWVVAAGRDVTLGADLLMSLAWALLAAVLTLASPWACLALPGLVLLTAILLVPRMQGYELYPGGTGKNATALASLACMGDPDWVEWELRYLGLAERPKTVTWRTNAAPRNLYFLLAEVPSPYRLVMLPYGGRVLGWSPPPRGSGAGQPGAEAFPGMNIVLQKSDLLDPGILRGNKSMLYLSGRVAPDEP